MGWYSNNWKNRIAITVNYGQVGATLTNFPIFLDLSTLPARFFSVVRTDGGDIRITQLDGVTEVAREIVAINTVGKTGEVHFNAPSLSSTADTSFYIYFNNPSATDYAANATYGKYNVWDSNYLYVAHLNGSSVDSTVNQTAATDTTITYGASYGKLGQGALFNGSTSGINLAAFNKSVYTVEAFTYLTSTAGWIADSNSVLANYNGAAILGFNSSIDPEVYIGGWNTGSSAASLNTWESIYITSDSSGANLYMNGVNIWNNATKTNGFAQTGDFNIGYRADAHNSPYTLTGYLDEFRLSNIARSSTWLSTQYNNQNSPSTFYSLSGVQSNGGGAFLFNLL